MHRSKCSLAALYDYNNEWFLFLTESSKSPDDFELVVITQRPLRKATKQMIQCDLATKISADSNFCCC